MMPPVESWEANLLVKSGHCPQVIYRPNTDSNVKIPCFNCRNGYIKISPKAVVTVNLKDALKENYQNHNCACADTRGNYRDRKFVMTFNLATDQNYYNHTHLDQA